MGSSAGVSIRGYGIAVLLVAGCLSYGQGPAAPIDPVLAQGLQQFNDGQYANAFPSLQQAANHGSPVAMRYLGLVYADGLGRYRRDPKWGLQWFQRAANAGDIVSASYIGDDYAHGSVGKPDPALARFWYAKSDAAKDARGTAGLAEAACQGTGQKVDLLRCGQLLDAASGFQNACDPHDVKPRIAADEFALGGMYVAAKGAPRSPARAASWYAKSAALGQLSAALAEAKLYIEPGGLPRNLVKAKAVLDGFLKSYPIKFEYTGLNTGAKSVAAVYVEIGAAYEGRGGSTAAEAVPLYEAANHLGMTTPAVLLALRYAKGDGLPKDVAKATDLLLALTTGPEMDTEARSQYISALEMVSKEYADGTGVTADPVKSAMLAHQAATHRLLPPMVGAEMAMAEGAPVPSQPTLLYPNMLAPPSVAPSAQFPVSVSLNSAQFDQGTSIVSGPQSNGKLQIQFPNGITSIQIMVTLLASKMTAADGVYQRSIELTQGQDSTPALFTLQAGADSGTSSLFATLTYNGAVIGMIRRDVAVAVPAITPPVAGPAAPVATAAASQPATADQAAPSASMAMRMAIMPPSAGAATLAKPAVPSTSSTTSTSSIHLNPEERAPDMTILEQRETDGSLHYTVTTKENEFDESTQAGATTIAAIVAKDYNDLEGWGEQLDGGTLTAQQVKNYVDGETATLYDQQAPDAFKRMYTKLEKRGERPQTILVLTDKPTLPWELLRPTSSDGKREDPLGLTVAIVHTNSSSMPPTPPPLTASVQSVNVVAPTYTSAALAGAQQEVKNMQVVFPNLKSVAGNLNAVTVLAKNLPDGIVHYAGHGVIATQHSLPSDVALELGDSNTMDPSTWKNLAEEGESSLPAYQQTHPFYFFNACDQGQSQAVLNYVDGWAPALMASGASGYLGALWKVSDTTAESFSKHFYTELAQKMQGSQPWSVAEVVMDARAATYQEKFDPTALAYILYSHPYLTMVSQQQ